MLELADGLQIAAVLVVDDRRDQVEEVIEDLCSGGCAVTFCSSQQAASDLLSAGVAFDLVVLDWHLEAKDSTVAALVLTDILDYCFVPVAVWTNFLPEAQEELLERKHEFPTDMIFAWDKKVGAEGLREQMIKWLNENPQARLGLLWSRSIRLSLAAPIRQLHELQGGELGSLAKYVWSKGFGRPQLAAAALLELLQSLLAREMLDRSQLIERIVNILEPERESAGQMPPEKFADFRSVEMYSVRAGTKAMRCGTIMDLGEEPRKFGVVLTPDCEFPRAIPESDYVFLARAQERHEFFEERAKQEERPMGQTRREAIVKLGKWRYHSLPFVPVDKGKMDLIVDFQDVEACLLKNAKTKIEDGTWKIIATVESPYRENLVQRYVWFTGRIGIPDLLPHVTKYLAGD